MTDTTPDWLTELPLKLCPFCGDSAKMAFTHPFYVECSNCGARAGTSATPEGAAEEWNVRSNVDA